MNFYLLRVRTRYLASYRISWLRSNRNTCEQQEKRWLCVLMRRSFMQASCILSNRHGMLDTDIILMTRRAVIDSYWFYVGRFGLLVPSSVRSVTWCSTTNQRSALTTTRRMLRAAAATADLSILMPDMSARFAAGSSQKRAIWKSTCLLYMVLVTSGPSSVTFALGCSSTSMFFRATLKMCIKSKAVFGWSGNFRVRKIVDSFSKLFYSCC